METHNLGEIYSLIESAEVTTLITYYFVTYVVLTLIQSILNTEVTILNLQVNRKILSGALIVYISIYLHNLVEGSMLFESLNSDTSINVTSISILLTTLIVFKQIARHILAPFFLYTLGTVKANESKKGRTKAKDEREFIIAYDEIKKEVSRHSKNTSVWLQHHIVNITISTIVLLSVYKQSITAGNLMLIIVLYFIYVGLKNKILHFGDISPLSKNFTGGFIKTK